MPENNLENSRKYFIENADKLVPWKLPGEQHEFNDVTVLFHQGFLVYPDVPRVTVTIGIPGLVLDWVCNIHLHADGTISAGYEKNSVEHVLAFDKLNLDAETALSALIDVLRLEWRTRTKSEITCSAIKVENGTVYECPKPMRHYHVMREIVDVHGGKKPVTGEQGFTTADSRFLDRKTAYRTARLGLQILDDVVTPKFELYSEDVW